ncbi:MAG: type II toxin-antitoxin system VapC family toxin [Chloroflexota bacterium]|nr:type II toxin-antitoxin system VapC family toxin [Chloroflexota bacterium]
MALNSLLLDTSAYSVFRRGHPQVVQALQEAKTILIPATVLGELLAGFAAGSRREDNRSELEEFLRSARVHTVPIGTLTAERYAHIYAYLRGIGRPIPTNDLWIAASAMEHGSELLTTDRHYLDVPQIIVRYVTSSE